MKKIISMFLVVVLIVVSLIGCSNETIESEYDEENNRDWNIVYEDSFTEPVLISSVDGVFTSSSNNISEAQVVVTITKSAVNSYTIMFLLSDENGGAISDLSDVSSARLDANFGNNTEDNNLYILSDGLYALEINPTTAALPGRAFYQALYNGEDIDCTIYADSNRCSFLVKSSDIATVCANNNAYEEITSSDDVPSIVMSSIAADELTNELIIDLERGLAGTQVLSSVYTGEAFFLKSINPDTNEEALFLDNMIVFVYEIVLDNGYTRYCYVEYSGIYPNGYCGQFIGMLSRCNNRSEIASCVEEYFAGRADWRYRMAELSPELNLTYDVSPL